ncbi:hypothetical protein CDG76_12385 [Nostoc sp. 'Peltigera membranacea cyanobiont' 210A]|uniref:hypothetical protein n=1 Tax=Nostoc sp. 'Peltigera membranacea cyanobiont' 210A TaxID=2014529 RepID=UPI000B953008|nr:hypothetical protein [Nostoc sp. 'Peltigera membranacea cyanobiont' 210A]OYD95724.1 hypothetical protein CDG76_12385 [Nostoc sp. 'Peltigera membranacea cyanobiont' 210A]
MTSNNPNNQTQNVSGTPIDLNQKAKNIELKLDETEYIIKSPKSKVEEWSKIGREVSITLASLTAIGFMCYFCFQTIQSNKTSSDDKKWAQSTLTFIVGGGVGYISGKSQKDS